MSDENRVVKRGRPPKDSFPEDHVTDTPLEAISDWIAENGLEQSGEYKIYLYELLGVDSRAFVHSWTDELPEMPEIAKIAGPGRFSLLCRGGGGKIKTVIVRISERYAEINRPKVEQSAAGSGLNGIEQSLSIVERLFEKLVQPIMRQGAELRQHEVSSAAAIPAPAPAPFADVYNTMLKDMNKLAIDTARQSITQAREMRELAAGLVPVHAQNPNQSDEEDEEEDEEEMTIAERIIPLVEQWLPALLGNPLAASAVAPIVKAAPDFVELSKDRAAMEEVAKYVAVKFGREALGDMVSRLGLPPALVQVVSGNSREE